MQGLPRYFPVALCALAEPRTGNEAAFGRQVYLSHVHKRACYLTHYDSIWTHWSGDVTAAVHADVPGDPREPCPARCPELHSPAESAESVQGTRQVVADGASALPILPRARLDDSRARTPVRYMRKHPGLQSYTKEIMSLNETLKYGMMSAGPLCHPIAVTQELHLVVPIQCSIQCTMHIPACKFTLAPGVGARARGGACCASRGTSPSVSQPSRSDAKPCLSPSRRGWSGVIRMATWFVPETNPWSSPEPQPLYAMVL